MTLLSDKVQDLISKLLVTDPSKRFSAIEALQHPWFDDKSSDNYDVYTEKEKQLI
jgi:serine/threonine protein kinase